MPTAPATARRAPPARLLEEGLIRAGFLPPLPSRARLARRLERTVAAARPPRAGAGPPARMTAGRERPASRSAARHAG